VPPCPRSGRSTARNSTDDQDGVFVHFHGSDDYFIFEISN
jgi:hypothetical protein